LARTDCWCAAEPHQYSPAWVSGTPLDRPVVPPVYSSAARSVPDRSAMDPGSAEATSSKSSTGTPPGAGSAGCAPGTSTNRTPGAPPPTSPAPFTAAMTFGRNSTVVTMPTAPESFSACMSSSSLTRKSSGVTTAPARHAAE